MKYLANAYRIQQNIKYILFFLLLNISVNISGQKLITYKVDTIKSDSLYNTIYSIYGEYFENGTLSHAFFENENIYFKDWTPFSSCSYIDYKRTGIVKYYYRNGNVRSIYYCLNNRIIGPYLEFFSNNKLKVSGNYKDVNCLDEIRAKYDTIHDSITGESSVIGSTISIRSGDWFYYNAEGILNKKEIYINDKLVRVEEYTNDGNPKGKK
jgi:antitoxin component YwqK of YwqJK toxin-antitoxin module